MNKCKFCKKEFKKESTLASHVCEKKRRWAQQDDRTVQLGFHAWLKFIATVQTNRKRPYTYEDFIESSLYTAFVKFGRYINNLKAINSNDFVDYLLKHSVKVKDWTKEYPYTSYINDLVAKETPDTAIERSLKTMEKWAINNDDIITNFYKHINTNEAIQWILAGKISPWVFFCSSTAEELLKRMTPEQLNMLNGVIKPAVWKAKVNRYKSEVDSIKKVLDNVGI